MYRRFSLLAITFVLVFSVSGQNTAISGLQPPDCQDRPDLGVDDQECWPWGT